MKRLTGSGRTHALALADLLAKAIGEAREIEPESISVDRVLNAEGQVVTVYATADTYPDEP